MNSSLLFKEKREETYVYQELRVNSSTLTLLSFPVQRANEIAAAVCNAIQSAGVRVCPFALQEAASDMHYDVKMTHGNTLTRRAQFELLLISNFVF